MNIWILSVTVFLAGVIGFALHRASMCTVRAVIELLTSWRAFMLASFMKSSAWVLGVTLIFMLFLPSNSVAMSGWELSPMTLVGGVLFGVGAALNRGCAFSTLTRLGNGHLGMVLTLAGFLFGVVVFGFLRSTDLLLPLVETSTPLLTDGSWRYPLTLAIVVWMIWELVGLLRSTGASSWREKILAPRYRLSTTAALMGVSNAFIFVLVGVWPYTSLFSRSVHHVIDGAVAPPNILWILFIAVVIGIGISAWQGGRFRWQWQPQRDWIMYGIGGFLMGIGGGMIPGGNDMLILHGIPSLSMYAILAYIAILVGITLVLLTMRLFGQDLPVTNCSGDLCTADLDK